MIVHFPIALLIFAAILELFTLKKFHSKFRPAIKLLVRIGAVSAVIAAVFGWLLADLDGIEGELLDLHKQVGIATAALSLLVLFFLQKISKKYKSNQVLVYRSFLFFAALGVSVTGHFGASLTHGEDFLTEILPWNSSSEQPGESISFQINLTAYQAELNPETEMGLIGEVRMVLAHNCYKCHSGSKIEGELRLDEKEFVFAGGKSGKILIPGNPAESEIIRRINLRKGHKDVMPSKGKLLTDSEKQLLELWISKGAPWPDGAAQQSIYRVAELAPRKPILPRATAGMSNPIDLWVNEYFKENNLDWQAKTDDRTYLRRIYLDVIGLIPRTEELLAFSQDTRPDKRAIWLQNLLNRNDDYAMHWLTFWNDALRNDYTGTGYITNGRFNITDWLYTSIRDNKPYDQFVKQLLNPDEKSKGFIEGIRWRGTVNASQRTEVQAAQNVGQVILGLNLKCASCHDSFISDWKLEEAYAFANIFADSTLEVSRCEQPTGTMAKTKILWEELGDIDSAANRAEKLRQLADRLVQPSNGRMYRTIVNRVWKQMMGRGIVEPVDEMDNLPWSQDLLDWLAVDFSENGYDIKRLVFLIASSNIYQSQSVSFESAHKLIADDFQFKGLIRRRMTAEQFSDAVSQMIYPLFDSKEMKYKPYELLAEGVKKPSFARASLVANNPFLTALGRPNREIVSTSRDSQASLLQALELTNGERLNAALKNGAEKWKANYPNSDQLTQQLYQKALNRKPSLKELEIAKVALGQNPSSTQIQDFFWAVLLLPEFQMVY
ncbi:MAG: DUF1549 domain-containing protein [Bacteroidetes bacterium]|nr:DUF1549 domain-containing protein [Bacteroidota bacterium]